jgi:hypothetical protein
MSKSDLASSWLSACLPTLPVRPYVGFHWADVHEIWYLSIFRKSVAKIQISLKFASNNGYFTWIPIYFFDRISLNRELYRSKNTVLCSVNFVKRKSCLSEDNLERYGIAGQSTDENMAHVYFMLYTYKATYTLRLCNTYCFSTVTMVAWTRLNVKLCAHCLSCFILPRTLDKQIGSE